MTTCFVGTAPGMHNLTERFVDALHTLHRDKDSASLVELFGEDATLSKAGMPHDQRGRDGAQEFWTQYREVFDEIDATFHHQVVGDDIVFLEWTSKGSLADGTDFSYDGVSVLQGDDDTITAFRTYYDTAAFLGYEAPRSS